MYLHANAKLGLAGRLALVAAIEGGLSLKAAAAAFSVSPAVPAVLTVLTSALAHLSLEATFSLATGSAAIAGAWLVMIIGLMISVAPS